MRTVESQSSATVAEHHDRSITELKEVLRWQSHKLLNELKHGIDTNNANEVKVPSRDLADMAIRADRQEIFRLALSLETMGIHNELEGALDIYVILSHELEKFRVGLAEELANQTEHLR